MDKLEIHCEYDVMEQFLGFTGRAFENGASAHYSVGIYILELATTQHLFNKMIHDGKYLVSALQDGATPSQGARQKVLGLH